MMAQYRRIKTSLPPGTLLLFRLGDFYEMFFEDAQLGAQVLNLALTARQGVPMCGLPHHAAAGYIGRLLRSGHKVAICDQVEDARPGKLVKREVTQILSPGTHFDERMLEAGRNNFLAAACRAGSAFGLVFLDLTTGDFRATELASEAALLTELERLRPSELIVPAEASALRQMLTSTVRNVTTHEDWAFAPETAQFALRDHFKVATLDGFGLRGRLAAVGAAGAVIHYLVNQLRRDISHLTRLTFYQPADYLILDTTTLRNLEVLEPLRPDGSRETSLYGAVNRTVTPMGARRLRDWLSQPLAAVEPIRRRQDAVEAWLAQPTELDAFRAALKEVRDLERTISRLSVGTGNARDLVALRSGLSRVPDLRNTLERLTTAALAEKQRPTELPALDLPPAPSPGSPSLLAELAARLSDCRELVDLIGRAVVDDPPLALKEGGLIRDGYDTALDELRAAMRSGKDWIAALQRDEIARTGIQSLKVGFNSVFGYYLEVTKANLEKVPPHYVRKQTIANGERFITPELKEMEARILGAEERSTKLEYELFLRLRERALGQLRDIQDTAAALGELDVLAAFADLARLRDYCRPEVQDGGQIVITDGRHPVLEQTLTEERFVPNDTGLASQSPGGDGRSSESAASESGSLRPPQPSLPQICLITGPNMAGKSTYIRQVALLVLLAHTGAFVPARSARIDLVDRIFTRIGASDDLSRGQSTFMVEMAETANILNNATARSLVILDEIGRGTSTFDGLSLAWSIVEHLHHQVGAKTLFATHYHELTELAARLPRLKNFNVAVREWNDQIIFLRKIVAGGTDKSYGIQVARLAGVPRSVIERAKVILRNLEESELTPEGTVRHAARHRAEREKLKAIAPPSQLDLFG
ncbi:MAG: DNA mismatch repair protein MutS [Verrucomicrobia bacterium]|nr:DNA mismatch repair protein MutS [Verrucomicrobiota bacterium]